MDQPDLDTSVPDWLIEYPHLLKVFEELRIDYSCGGKSLDYVCREQGRDPRHVLLRLQAALQLNPGSAPIRPQAPSINRELDAGEPPPLVTQLRVLLVEDRASDARLIINELRLAEFEPQWERVETEQDYVAHLDPSLDIILADFSLPQFDAWQALSLLNRSGFDIPFIVISGSIGEELAIQVMQRGAADYLAKDRLGRLGQSVKRALELKRLRTEKRQVEQALRSAETLFRGLVEHSLVGIHIIQDGKYAYVNPKLAEIFGYTSSEVLAMDSWLTLIAEVDRDLVSDHFQRRISNEVPNARYEFRGLRKNGIVIDLEVLGSSTELNGRPAVIGSLIDITERKRAETALRESEERLRLTTSSSNTGLWDWDLQTNRVFFSTIWKRQIGFEEHEISDGYDEWKSRVHPDDLERALASISDCVEYAKSNYESEFRLRHKDGSYRWILSRGSLLLDERGQPCRMRGAHIDVTALKQTEEKLKQTAERLSTLLVTSQSLGSTLNLDSILNQLLSRLKEVIPVADFGAIYIYDPQAEVLIPRASIGVDWDAIRQIRLKLGESLSGRVFQWGRSVITRTPYENEATRGIESPETRRLFAQARYGRQIQSNICVPLRSPTSEIIGTIALGSACGAFKDDDLSLLEAIAAHAAIAIQEAKLFDEVRAGRERLQILSQQLITTQETERRHLARELHDEIGQMLTAIKMHLRSTARSVAGTAQQSLEASISMIDSAIDQVRNLSLSLRPAQLDELGLVAALHWYVKNQAQVVGFTAQLQVDPVDIQVPSELATACFRITQEAITNSVRHGQVSQIDVDLRIDGGMLHLRICDNGVGFDVNSAHERATQGKSLGLLGMHERAQLLGGTLEIVSTVGKGTSIHAQFPW